MEISPLEFQGQYIQSYGPGFFRIGDRVYACPVIVFPDMVVDWNVGKPVFELEISDFFCLLDRKFELDVMLLGTGIRYCKVGDNLQQAMREAGMLLESMDTGAACRTYNVLVSENRPAAAALIPL